MGVSEDYWDKAYADGTYLSKWDYEFPSQELIGVLSALDLQPQTKILDLGCGGGRDAIYMAQLGFSVSAIDLSAVAINLASERAKEKGVNVKWHIGNVTNLPYEDDSFEIITDRACFHHISHENRHLYVREVFRTLKEGGHLLIRGSFQEKENSFYAVTELTIHEHFKSGFSIGRIYPITLANNAGKLSANMVLIKKSSRS